MHLSWIIPAYNEERRIERTVREVESYLRAKNFDHEILVIDNGSRDKTAEIVKRLAGEIPTLSLFMVHEGGKGGAVKKGMLEAKGEIRLFSDADNSTSPDHFDKMAPLFAEGCQMVISSRDRKDAAGAGRDVAEPWYREILGNMGNLVIQTFGVWGIWDTQNGFKACTAAAADKIFSQTKISGFAFDIEMLALARRFGYKVAIIPVKWKFDPDSKVTLGAYLSVFLDVFRIRWNLIRGAYAKN
ncbi:MAG: Glycosyl transferase family protein [Parcubacteria group bacterium GW2011_GWC2_52_8c]|nr:MAG: Glycosyl transferase family protein [Parcubacteria group bacterium GW2011_GWA1_51_12]KKW30122.1 MAG: Glycosyl transferase family protein [Parcubacteria group bacterium GW2011_GWC2_52_8c]